MKNKAKKTARGSVTLNRKAVFVSITDALKGNNPTVLTTTPLPDTARDFWYVSDAKVKQCELLVAVDAGTIKGVWEIDMAYSWRPMAINAIPTRNVTNATLEPSRKHCQLLGTQPDEVWLVGNSLSAVKGVCRMYGPVRYNF